MCLPNSDSQSLSLLSLPVYMYWSLRIDHSYVSISSHTDRFHIGFPTFCSNVTRFNGSALTKSVIYRRGCYVNITWVLHEYYVCVTWILRGCYVNITYALREYYVGVTWILRGCYMNITYVLREYYVGVTWILRMCYVNITWVLREYYVCVTCVLLEYTRNPRTCTPPRVNLIVMIMIGELWESPYPSHPLSLCTCVCPGVWLKNPQCHLQVGVVGWGWQPSLPCQAATPWAPLHVDGGFHITTGRK